MKAAIYTRVSTEEQVNEGYSIDEQERRCRSFIEGEEDWTLVEVFKEEGVSGKLRSRPALDQLLARADEFDVVVVHSLDRLGRSTKNLLELYDRFEADHVALVFLRERLDTTTPVGRLLRTVLSAIAEFERDLIVERTRLGLAKARRLGVRLGRPPVERPPPDNVRALKRAGKTWSEIATQLGCTVWAAREAAKNGGRKRRRRTSANRNRA